jgi:hypothetical protein
VTELPGPVELTADPRDRDERVVSFLSAHVGLLDDYESRFYHAMKYRVKSETNHITPAQREYLYQLEAVVKGMLAQDEASQEQMRRSAHWLAIKNPNHVSEGCDLCDELRRERERADRIADIQSIEEAAILQGTAKRKGLRVPTIEELAGAAVVGRVRARSLQGDPAALTVTSILEGPSNG